MRNCFQIIKLNVLLYSKYICLAKCSATMEDKRMRQNNETKIYKCEICDNEFKNINVLRQHFKNVHNSEKNFKGS